MQHQQLMELAGERSFKRGLKYFQQGKVTDIRRSLDNQFQALVNGRESYSVTLSLDDGNWQGECSCPASDHSDFCKHCVAVALSIEADEQLDSAIKAKLNRLTKAELIELLGRALYEAPEQYQVLKSELLG